MNYEIVEYCYLHFITEMSDFHTVVNQNQTIVVAVYLFHLLVSSSNGVGYQPYWDQPIWARP